jgi:hypothetical protein
MPEKIAGERGNDRDPFKRPAKRILKNIRDGFEKTKKHYGAEIDPIMFQETRKRREKFY